MTYLPQEIARIEAELAAADRDVANYNHQIATVEQSRDALNLRLQALQRQLQDVNNATSQVGQIQQTIASLNQALADVRTQIASTTQQRDAAIARVQASRQRLSTLTASANQIPTVQAQITAKEREVADLSRRLEELRRRPPRRNPRRRDEDSGEYEAWLEQLNALSGQLSDAQGALDNLRQQLAQLTASANQIPGVQAEIAAGERDIANFNVQLQTLNQRQAEQQGQLNEQNQRLNQLQGLLQQRSQLQASIAAGEQERATLMARIEELTGDRVTAQRRVEDARAELAHHQHIQTALTQEPAPAFEVLEPIAAELTARTVALSTALEQARARLQMAQNQLTEANQATATLPAVQAQYDLSAQELASLNSQVSQLSRDRESTRNQLQSLQQQLEALNRQIDQLESQATSAEQEVVRQNQRIDQLQQAIEATELEILQLEEPELDPRGKPTRLTRLRQLRALLERQQQDQQAAIATRDQAQATAQNCRNQLPPLRSQQPTVQTQIQQTSTRLADQTDRLDRLTHNQTTTQTQTTALQNRLTDLTRLSQQAPQAQATVESATQTVNRLDAQLQEFVIARDAATARLMGFSATAGSATPIALLPVRLETRFTHRDAIHELLIRIYPDDVQIDTHEPELTDDEVTWGQHYWEQIWRMGNDATVEPRAWAQITERFGPERAAWIVRSLEPLNPADRPTTARHPNTPLEIAPQFPEVPRRAAAWTRAPQTRVLPDRWVAIGYQNGQRLFTQWGQPVPAQLATGPAPTAGLDDLSDTQLPVDEGMRWLIDFDAAVNVGMGVRVPLSETQWQAGVERLVVLGVKTSLDQAATIAQLESLFDAHHYTSGLAFVSQGTPTNNTPLVTSGYQSRSPASEVSYAIERGAALTQPGTDGTILAQLLGLSNEVFAHIAQADGTEQQDAQAMNTVLWPATWGYFLEQMMAEVPSSAPNPLTDRAIQTARHHFIRYVRARGPLPTIRIGRQPYGILPVTSLNQWQTSQGQPDRATATSETFDRPEVIQLLRKLRRIWSTALIPTANRDLLAMLRQTAISQHYTVRELLGGDYLWNLNTLLQQDRSQLEQSEQAILALLAPLGLSWRPRLSRTFYPATEPIPITAPRVLADLTDPVPPDYLNWLLQADYEALHQGLDPHPQTLLYQLLRHAALLEYGTTAFRLLQQQGIVQWRDRREPELIDLTGELGSTPTLWRRLLQTHPGNQQILGSYLSGLSTFTDPIVANLGEFRASLSDLASRSPAVLDRLLSETLDLSSHRLDAWITSLATRRLTELRQQPTDGLVLGGYGWVENLKPATSRRSEGYIHAPSLTHAATAAVLRNGYLSHQDNDRGQALAIDLSSERVRLALWLLDGVRQGQPLGALLGYRFERGLHENHQGLVLDRYILPFRRLAPLAIKTGTPGIDRQIVALETQIPTLTTQKRDLEQRTAQLQSQVISAQQTLDATQKQLQALQKIDSSDARIAQLEREKQTAEQRVAQLKADLAQTWEEIERIKIEIEQILEGNLNRSDVVPRDQVMMMRDEVTMMRDDDRDPRDRDNRDRELRLLRQALKRQEEEAQRLQTTLSAAQVTADTTRRLLEEVKAVRVRVGILTNQVTEQQAKWQTLSRQLEAANRELDQVQQQLTQTQAKLNELLYDQRTVSTLAANNVVDGLALLHRWQTATKLRDRVDPEAPNPWNADTIPFGHLDLPTRQSPEGEAILQELRALADAVDAISDVITAEGVYQLVQGNPLRAGAMGMSLDAIARGETPPADLEVVRTPRTGIGLTHRMLVLFSGTATADSWPIAASQVRAQAEPHLNAWVAQLLGDPHRVFCQVTYHEPETQALLHQQQVSLADLGLSPLDLLYLPQTRSGDRALELEQYWLYHLRRSVAETTLSHTEIRLNFERDPNWGEDRLSVHELLELLRTIHPLVMGARAIDARDLALPEVATDAAIDLNELNQRADRVVQVLQQIQTTFAEAEEAPDDCDLEGLRQTCLQLAQIGVSGAIPRSAIGNTPDDRQMLLEQVQWLRREVDQRMQRVIQAETGFDREIATPATQRDYHLECLQAVLGDEFRVLPQCHPAHLAELSQTFAHSTQLQAGNPLEAVTWFQRSTRVRPGTARLDAALMYAEALGNPARLDLQVGQLPYQPTARWVGLPATPQQPLSGGKLSLVAHLPGGLPADQPIAGLLIDEWVEVVPNASETTGITFHFDQPGARAPQAILLAVSPSLERPWNLHMLEAIALETLELAKLRSINPNQLGAIGHFLPALYLANNASGDTIAADCRPLIRQN